MISAPAPSYDATRRASEGAVVQVRVQGRKRRKIYTFILIIFGFGGDKKISIWWDSPTAIRNYYVNCVI